MKTGLTIQQMAQELLRQSKAKQDYLVNTGSLSLSVTSDAPQLRVTENGLDKIAPLDIRQTAHRQLGTYLGIPQKYYELMRTDAPELLAYNANYWFSQKNELRTLRTMDGCARAFLSNRYRRIDNLDIASVTLPVIGELPEARFVSTQITDDFMYIKVVNPRLQADVVPGDVVQAGVIISNSETGLGSVTIQPLIYRLVCSNGMVINDAKTRRNSTDLEDIFIAHIAGMDVMARALESAAKLLEESPYKKMLADRYASFDSGKGKEFEDGKLTLEDLVAYAKANGEPKQTSGKQELYEAIVNMYC